MYLLIFIGTFAATFFGVEFFRRWSVEREILDVPNARSSHEVPIPRGGGLVFVVVILAAYIIYQIFFAEIRIWSYLVGAVLIASISWLDDIFSLSFIWRLAFHMLAAIVIVSQIGYWDSGYIPLIGVTRFGYIGYGLTIFWIVGLTNAYNFMDGIDGIAGVQAITAAIGWVLTGYFLGLEFFLFFGLVIIFVQMAFLYYNWQPAKIFMGDVGSSFLGYTFAAFPLLGASIKNSKNMTELFPLLAVLFVWLFVFDTLQTIVRRLIRGEKLWEAHRRHIYQKLIIDGRTHASVSSLYGVLSLLVVTAGILFVVVFANDLWLLISVTGITSVLLLAVFGKFLLTKQN